MSDIEEPDSSLESIRERLRALGDDLDRPRPEPSASAAEESAVESLPSEPDVVAGPRSGDDVPVATDVPEGADPPTEESSEAEDVDGDEPPVEWSSTDSVEIVREEVMVIEEPDPSSTLGFAGPDQHHGDSPPSVGPSDEELAAQSAVEPQGKPDQTATYLFRIVVILMFAAGLIAIAIALL